MIVRISETLKDENDKIPKEFIKGRLYHTSWAKNRGYVWRLIDFNIETDTAN